MATTGRQVSDGASAGQCFGQSSTDLIGFYGLTTPIVRPTGGSAVTVHTITTASQTTTPYGFATSTQADAVATDLAAVVTSLNLTNAALRALGLLT